MPLEWLFGPQSARNIVSYLSSPTQGGFAAKKSRFLGVDRAGPTDASQRTAWLARMAAAYPKVAQGLYFSPDYVFGTDATYDAVYWLAYGLAAAGPGAPLTGPSFATGVRKLLAGPKIHPAPDAIADAFRLLSVGGATFEGTLEETAAGIAPRYDVLRFNRTTGALDGTFDCFAGF